MTAQGTVLCVDERGTNQGTVLCVIPKMLEPPLKSMV